MYAAHDGGLPMQFHILSFEGPDPYSRAGGLATRTDGLVRTLADLGFETHLWFVGDPKLPGHEINGALHLHRWAQWVSAYHPAGVYDGEQGKYEEYTRSLPPYLVEHLLPALRRGEHAVVLAEEWHTARSVAYLSSLLERAQARDKVTMLWNANNTFGFDRIDWPGLRDAASITTVSRYMKHQMRPLGVDALVVPNGLSRDAFELVPSSAYATLRARFGNRTVIVKMARWDPDKRWLSAVEITATMKQAGWRPLLIARGGSEPHGAEVLEAIAARGLVRVDRVWRKPGVDGILDALQGLEGEGIDVVNLCSHVDPNARRLLFRGSDAVLANSSHEPFGLVGLETMAAGGLACTGCTGEDYALPGRNALVLETGEAGEFMGMFASLRGRPRRDRAIRRAGRLTARGFSWLTVVQNVLLPRIALASADLELEACSRRHA